MIKAFVHGNLSADVEGRAGKNSGKMFYTFSVASNVKDTVTWVNCVMFDSQLYDFNKERLVKGARAELYGDLRVTQDAKGNSRVEFTVRDIISLYVKSGSDSAPRASAPKTGGFKPKTKAPVNEDSEPGDEDAPFL